MLGSLKYFILAFAKVGQLICILNLKVK